MEKSVLLYNEFSGSHDNIALAVCGSSFNKMQLKLLLRNFELNEIIIAFDKEYKNYPSNESNNYYLKLLNMCKKYRHYCSFSFIFDTENLLEEKDSPVDKGKAKFNKLLKNRVSVK